MGLPRLSQVAFRVSAVSLLLGLAGVVAAQSYVPNEVIVKPRPPATIQQVLQNEDIDSITPVGSPELGAYLVHSPTEDTPTLISRLSARPDVEYVEPNSIISIPEGEGSPHGVPALSAPAFVALALALSVLGSLLAGRQPRPAKR